MDINIKLQIITKACYGKLGQHECRRGVFYANLTIFS